VENTGRILQGLTNSARRILFGGPADASLEVELRPLSQVDIAHLVMLAECGIVDNSSACKLIKEIEALRTCNFEPLRGQIAIRGLYMLYEGYLIQRLGAHIGGILQTGRSRNDLNATVLRLRLREPYIRLLQELLRLQVVLLRRSRRFADVTMPAYTHYQAAVPITYGHYLAGVGWALARDIAGITTGSKGLNICPLGAGAVGGTSLPIKTRRTASLLGFDEPALNSVDAVASRDLILRLLASLAILGVTLSRISADLLLWTTSEFGFLTVSDSLVGSSSMMPQKRNLFLLEHVQGRSTAAIGAFVHSSTAMHSTPFTNSIAVGTEAVSPVWNALRSITEAVTLLRLVLAGAAPQADAMLRAATRGHTSATELANRLATQGNMSFRTAHHAVGKLIRSALENGGGNLEDLAARWQKAENVSASLGGLDPASVARSSTYGGGPGSDSLNASLKALYAEWVKYNTDKREQVSKWRKAKAALDEAAHNLCAFAGNNNGSGFKS
jgi:argininosuccinate lyase